jgi:hypothetical protein
VLIIGLKTALMVLGAALLTTVLLQAVIEPPEAPEPTLTGHEISQSLQPETDS